MVILTTLIFGLLPALRASRPELHGGLKDAAPARPGLLRHGVRDTLVAVEIALAVMLLGSAGLMGKSLMRVLSTDPGFRPEGLVGLELSLAEAGAPDPGALVALKAQVQGAVEGIPGVSLAARVNRMPATGSGGSHSFVRPDRPRPTGPEPEGYYREVSPGYFRTLGIPLLGGRDFGPEDSRGSAPVVIVNRALQERYFPGEDAIGKTIRPIYSASGAALTIVGVVGDQTLGGLDEARPAVLYYPDAQSVSPRWAVVVRSDRPGVGEELRRAIRDAAPGLVVGPTRRLGEVLQEAPTMFLRRYPVFLLGVFAAVALLLACVGIFGVVSFGVAERTREFGIRMAVGAVRRDIVGLVLRGSSGPIVAGALAGLAGVGGAGHRLPGTAVRGGELGSSRPRRRRRGARRRRGGERTPPGAPGRAGGPRGGASLALTGCQTPERCSIPCLRTPRGLLQLDEGTS